MAKLLERIACEQIQEYLEDANLLDPFQFAYRRGHSTQTCLLRVLDDFRQAADRRMITVSIFFDLSKAFDRVQHDILLNKLKTLKLSDLVLHWIHSYLTDRCQAVRDPASLAVSSPAAVDVDIPQGSVFGPLLFVLYLIDFKNILKHCKYCFYTDDLVIYYHGEPRDIYS